MSVIEALSLAGSIASIILAILAIVFSILFYFKSNKSSEDINDATKDIRNSVAKLEQIFNTLYSDTFSMMKDTVTDMRKHVWSENRISDPEKTVNEKENKLREELEIRLAKILEEQKKGKEETKQELKSLLDEAISKVKKIESDSQAAVIREIIVNELKTKGRYTLSELVGSHGESFRMHDFAQVSFNMRKEGLVKWDGPMDQINVSQPITPTEKYKTALKE